MRIAVAAAVSLAALAVGAGGAGATNECKGLQICVRVAGPWVVVPARVGVPRSRAEFQLSCPRGFVVGGTDAELSDRAIDVAFYGKLGSPVNPGVTTSKDVVFLGRLVRGSDPAPSFRPHIGCVPTSGGGRSTTAYTAAKPKPLVRRVHTVTVHGPGPFEAVTVCRDGERLVGVTYAVGFRTHLEPPPPVLAGVRVTLTRAGARSIATVTRAAGVPALQRVVLQIQLLCAAGPR
jgi:hypothetical protein